MPDQVVADRIDCLESSGKNAFGCVSVTGQMIDQRADSVRLLPAFNSDCGCGKRIPTVCLLLAFSFGHNAPVALATRTREAIAVKKGSQGGTKPGEQ